MHNGGRARLRRALIATVLVSAAAAAFVPKATAGPDDPARPGAPEKPGGVALTWAPTFMADTHVYTRAEAIEIANRHDLVGAMPIAFRDHAAAMRAANPDLTLVSYVNGTLAKASKVSHLPETAFAHDAQGQRITSQIWGTTVMAPTSPDWRREIDGECRERSDLGGYDGCMVDSMGLGIFAANQNFTGVPVNPATGAAYTQLEYRNALAGLASYLRTSSPDLVHAMNSVENDWRYWRDAVPSRPLVLEQPAVVMEDFLRGAASSVTSFPKADKWLRNVEVIRDLEANNVTGLISTKLWVAHTAAQAAQWQAYAMASFLMGADGNSYLAFTRTRDQQGAIGANTPYRMPEEIGLPQGAMVRAANGSYTRLFSNGMVAVNPTTATVTVSLPSPMRRLDGTVVTSLQLPPNTGEVMVKSAAAGDTVAPTGTYSAITVSPAVSQLSLSGTASDDTSVKKVALAVRRISDGSWLRADGTWSASYQRVPATMAAPLATSTTWSHSRSIAPGTYGVALIVEDAAGNLNLAPRPYQRVIVP